RFPQVQPVPPEGTAGPMGFDRLRELRSHELRAPRGEAARLLTDDDPLHRSVTHTRMTPGQLDESSEGEGPARQPRHPAETDLLQERIPSIGIPEGRRFAVIDVKAQEP